MSLFKTIYKKELRDSLRDRRAIMISLLPALFAPILMAAMFHFMVQTRVSTNEITVPIIGKENAPDLIQYLEKREVKFEDYEGNPKEDIQNKNIKIVVEIPDDFEENFANSKPAIIYIHSDGSLDKSRADGRRIGAQRRQHELYRLWQPVVARGQPWIGRPTDRPVRHCVGRGGSRRRLGNRAELLQQSRHH